MKLVTTGQAARSLDHPGSTSSTFATAAVGVLVGRNAPPSPSRRRPEAQGGRRDGCRELAQSAEKLEQFATLLKTINVADVHSVPQKSQFDSMKSVNGCTISVKDY